MVRVFENDGSWGPPGLEYPFPTEVENFPTWFDPYCGVSISKVECQIHSFWQPINPAAEVISECLKTFKARSLYQIPHEESEPDFYLLFENSNSVLYITKSPQECTVEGIHPDLKAILDCFDGLRFGIHPGDQGDFMLPDSGFSSVEDLKPITKDVEHYLWDQDETVLGGFHFFTNNCGNKFYCRKDGSIAKWMMPTSEIQSVYKSCLDFAEGFKKFITAGEFDEDSPFSY